MHTESIAMLFYGYRETCQYEWHSLNWNSGDEIPQQSVAEELHVFWQEFWDNGKEFRCIATYCEAAHSHAERHWQAEIFPIVQDHWERNMRKYAESIGVNLRSQKPAWHLVTWISS